MRKLIMTAALAAMPLAAAAQDPLLDAVKARQAYFSLLGANMGTLAGMAKGKIDFDQDAAVTAASNIEALSTYNAAPHFLPGTSADDLGADVTEAKANIWTDFAGVGAKLQDFQMAAAGAGDALAGGKDALGPLLGKIGGTCKACHDEYRVK